MNESRLTWIDQVLGSNGYVTTDVLVEAAATKEYRRVEVAALYAVAIAYDPDIDWAVVNKAIVERWSLSALKWIKRLAWAGVKANGHGAGTAAREFTA